MDGAAVYGLYEMPYGFIFEGNELNGLCRVVAWGVDAGGSGCCTCFGTLTPISASTAENIRATVVFPVPTNKNNLIEILLKLPSEGDQKSKFSENGKSSLF